MFQLGRMEGSGPNFRAPEGDPNLKLIPAYLLGNSQHDQSRPNLGTAHTFWHRADGIAGGPSHHLSGSADAMEPQDQLDVNSRCGRVHYPALWRELVFVALAHA